MGDPAPTNRNDIGDSRLEPVQEIHADVKFLRDINTSAVVKPYDALNEFYNDLVHAMNTAGRTLDLTHIRHQPSADFGESTNAYFDRVLGWIDHEPSRWVRRLSPVRTRQMEAWARELASMCEREPRLEVRVVDWSMLRRSTWRSSMGKPSSWR